MKKVLLALLVIIAAVGACVGISIYGKKHIHTYTYKTIKEPDCTHEVAHWNPRKPLPYHHHGDRHWLLSN